MRELRRWQRTVKCLSRNLILYAVFFKACGKTAVIDESKMKEIIAVNGSSPAFIYLYAKGFIDYAVKEGIDGEVAKKLFCTKSYRFG